MVFDFTRVKSDVKNGWNCTDGKRSENFQRAHWHQIKIDTMGFCKKHLVIDQASEYLHHKITTSKKFRKDMREILNIWDQKNK